MSRRRAKNTEPVSSRQVRGAILSIVGAHLPLGINGRELDDEMLWDILIYASVNRTTIETACNELEGVPSGNTVRDHLTCALGDHRSGVVELEARLNLALKAQLPRPVQKSLFRRSHEIAIDLTQIPYHGRPAQDEDEIRRGKAKSGTTHFHSYATLAIVHDNRRYELALTFVWADETMEVVVKRLIRRARALCLRIRRAYLDKGFCSSEVLKLLRRHRLPYIIPIPLRGKQGGIRALLKGTRSYRTRYTFNKVKDHAYTTDVVIVHKNSQGQYGRDQVAWFAYAVYNVDRIPPHQIFDLYRRRFGIESSYRQMNEVRARTTSTSPALRLLLVGLALIILNVYISLRNVWRTCRWYGSRVRYIWLTLKRLMLMLLRTIERLCGVSPLEQNVSSQLFYQNVS